MKGRNSNPMEWPLDRETWLGLYGELSVLNMRRQELCTSLRHSSVRGNR